jgi:hypothetical protein
MPNKPLMLKIILLLLTPISLFAQQEENWDVYLARYEKGSGSTLINMSVKQSAPKKELPFVIITGVTFKDCRSDGFPTKNQYDALYQISDSIKEIILNSTHSMAVGTFTYQCQRLDYYYVSDTNNLRSKLLHLFNISFPLYLPYINIREDKPWDAYLKFLYPNEETYEYMTNQKVIMKLQEAGDSLEKSRKVDHWLYFNSDSDRNCILPYLKQNNFIVESKEKVKRPSQSFSLHISRTDMVDIASITELTLELSKQAKKCNGNYDGWESPVMK